MHARRNGIIILIVTLSVFIALALAGCGAPPLEPEDTEPAPVPEGKFEAWNAANNPSWVDASFLSYVNQLPLSGHGPEPVPADYWPTFRDSLNWRWDGAASLSPAEKFAAAFAKPGTPEAVSLAKGVKSVGGAACTSDADCTGGDAYQVCASSYDATTRRCVATWWGICEGWAAYALMEPAARLPVDRTAAGNTVTFYPGDIEGLMSLLYTDVPVKFLSTRCNRNAPPTDPLGRVIAGECRDMNPGSWHVVVGNLMGARGQGFLLDQTFDAQVWNQPAYDFRIVNAAGGQLAEITQAEATALVGLGASYTYNPQAARFFSVEMDVRFVVEARPARTSHIDNLASYLDSRRYAYVLETTASGRILGGEWVGASRTDHPDFVWWPTGTPRRAMAAGNITYAEVKALSDESAGAVAADTVTVWTAEDLGPSSSWHSRYAGITVPPGYRRLRVTLSGSGDADLYVRAGAYPTTTVYDCRSATAGSSAESCTLDVPVSGTTVTARARTRTPGTVVDLVAERLR
jgi:hypothetical protein